MEDISFFFIPKSIVVFGASTNPQKSGYKLIRNIISHKFPGKLYLINPKGGEILGIKMNVDLSQISDEIELAIIFVPNSQVVEIIAQCIQKGIKGAIIESAGFEEVGDSGLKLKDEIKKITKNFSKFRIIGPNCTGLTYISKEQELFSSFVPMGVINPGNVAIISQSGFINGGFLLDVSTRYTGLGFRYICAIGNKMDINENELLDYIMRDPQIGVICLYIEAFSDVRAFIHLISEAQQKYQKAVILLRGGQSSIGSAATRSHTGALAEKSELIEAVIKQSHCILAEDFRDLFILAQTISFLQFNHIPLPKLPNVAILTISGGAGAVMSDWCTKMDIQIPILSEDSYRGLTALYPSWMPPNRFALVDIWPAVEKAAGDFENTAYKALEFLLKDPAVACIFFTAFYSEKDWPINWDHISKLILQSAKPLFIWIFGQYADVLQAEIIFQKIRIPLFVSERQMVVTLRKILDFARFIVSRAE